MKLIIMITREELSKLYLFILLFREFEFEMLSENTLILGSILNPFTLSLFDLFDEVLL